MNVHRNAVMKSGKNEPVNLKIIESICQALQCGIEDVVEKKLWDCREIYNYVECMESAHIFKKDTIFKDFLALNVHQNANRKSSSSDEMNFKNLVFMRVASKFV